MATKKTVTKITQASLLARRAPVAEKPKEILPHQIVLSSNVQSAVGMDAWSRFAGASDLASLVTGVRERVELIQGGNLGPVEAMLYGQAMTLQTMFTSLIRQAASETGLKQYQAKLTIALKAQAQCRSTLEALAEIKNPRPVSFVKQANIANGPQQVNNGTAAPARTANSQSQQNELLEDSHGGAYMDTGATPAAARSNPAVEAVEQVHRATKPRG